ncbi:MAG: TonB family protein [Bryobacterales bacterium]|nr:TonB family protein [Bryobacterales bacterium]
MFEQSLLINHAGARKTATFAVSLTAQIVVAGVLLVAPLLYHEVLPALRVPEIMPVLAIFRPPELPAAESQPSARSSGLALPHVFRVPVFTHSDYPQPSATIIDGDVPLIPGTSVFSGMAALPVGSPNLPRFETPPATTVVQPPAPVRVGGDVLSAKLIKQVLPAYPQSARQLRISGTVHLLGFIAKDGTIQRLQVLSGHPLLRQAALDAVSQWVYRPTVLNGQPVEVEAPIDVIFTLSR